ADAAAGAARAPAAIHAPEDAADDADGGAAAPGLRPHPGGAAPPPAAALRRRHVEANKSTRLVLPAMSVSVLIGVVVGAIICYVVGCAPVRTEPAVKERVVTPGERLCLDFMERKNRGDPTANDLLGPALVVPPNPVTEEEGQRLDTEIFLRRDYRIREEHPAGTGRRLLGPAGG